MEKERQSKRVRAWFYPLALTVAPLSVASQLDEFSPDEDIPIFMTPARMTSSYENAPNSVTRLDVDDLHLLGIDNVVDALRLVPGMFVSDIHGSNAAIGYHGSNVNVPRRMEVLYNGTSIYRPGYSNIHWHRLPVDINDLSAIEVVRGSNVVDFGSNAYSSTVNLIQKPKVLEPAFSGAYTTDGDGTHNAWLSSHIETENGHFNARYFREENTGFDKTETGQNVNDSSHGDNLIIGGEIEVDRNLIVDFQLGTNKYDFQPGAFPEPTGGDSFLLLATDLVSPSDDSTEKSTFFNLKATKQTDIFDSPIELKGTISHVRFKRKQEIHICAPSFMFDPLIEQLDNSPNVVLHPNDIPLVISSSLLTGTAAISQSIVAPLSLSDFQTLSAIGQKAQAVGPFALQQEVCGTSNQDVLEERQGVELQIVSKEEGDYQLSSTFSYSNTRATSETYLGGTEVVDAYSLSNNLRFNITDDLVLNAGLMLESNSNLDETYESYRVSLNYTPFRSHVIRATASRSQRSPDIYETSRQWNYLVTYDQGATDHNGQGSATLFRNAVSPDHLDPETIESIELGYTFFSSTSTFDIKYFRERNTDLISEQFQYLDFNLTNNGSLNNKGIELGFTHQPVEIPGLKIGGGYAYVDNDTGTTFEDSLYSQNSGNVWAIYPITDDLFISATQYYAEEIGGYDYKRTDLTLTRFQAFGGTDVTFRVNYRRYPKKVSSFTEASPVIPVQSRYDNHNRLTFSFELSY